MLSNKVKFILMVIKDELKIRNTKRKDIVSQLLRHGFQTINDLNAIMKNSGKTPVSTIPI